MSSGKTPGGTGKGGGKGSSRAKAKSAPKATRGRPGRKKGKRKGSNNSTSSSRGRGSAKRAVSTTQLPPTACRTIVVSNLAVGTTAGQVVEFFAPFVEGPDAAVVTCSLFRAAPGPLSSPANGTSVVAGEEADADGQVPASEELTVDLPSPSREEAAPSSPATPRTGAADPSATATRRGAFVEFESHATAAKVLSEALAAIEGSSFGDWQLCWAFTGMHHNGTGGGDATAVTVTGLGSNLTDADLYTLFVPVGGLVDARVLRDASTGDSSGRGRLVFARRRVAEEAVRAMDGLFVGGTCLGVALEADPDSPPTPSRGLAYPSHVRFASVADAATVAAEAPRSACRVHVTNLTSSEMSRETVRRAFEPFGRVREVRLAGTGAAVVTFASHAEAAQAIVANHGTHLGFDTIACGWHRGANDQWVRYPALEDADDEAAAAGAAPSFGYHESFASTGSVSDEDGDEDGDRDDRVGDGLDGDALNAVGTVSVPEESLQTVAAISDTPLPDLAASSVATDEAASGNGEETLEAPEAGLAAPTPLSDT